MNKNTENKNIANKFCCVYHSSLSITHETLATRKTKIVNISLRVLRKFQAGSGRKNPVKISAFGFEISKNKK